MYKKYRENILLKLTWDFFFLFVSRPCLPLQNFQTRIPMIPSLSHCHMTTSRTSYITPYKTRTLVVSLPSLTPAPSL